MVRLKTEGDYLYDRLDGHYKEFYPMENFGKTGIMLMEKKKEFQPGTLKMVKSVLNGIMKME